MSSELVIKVKYRETLRRFTALYNGDGSLSLNMAGLKAKIFSLFNIASNADVTLTYTDEDDDIVTLVDDADFHDAVKQGLCPLRITVLMNSDRSGFSDRSGTSSDIPSLLSSKPSDPLPSKGPSPTTAVGSQNLHDLASNMSPSTETVAEQEISLSKLVQELASKVALAAPDQYRDFVSKLSNDVVSKASATTPVSVMFQLIDTLSKLDKSSQQSWVFPTMSELIQTLSKLGVSRDDLVSKGQVGVLPKKQSSTPDKHEDSRVGDKQKASVPSKSTLSSALNYPSTSAGLSRSVSTSDTGTAANNKVCNDSSRSPLTRGIRFCREVGQKKSTGCSSSKRIPSVIPAAPYAVHPVPGITALPDGTQNNSSVSWKMGPPPVYWPPLYPLLRHHGRRYLNYDHMGQVVHLGVECDVCGVHPITGPRFKSKVKDDYDLCSVCFAQMGNDSDYTRLDHPICNRFSSKKFHGYRVEKQVVPPDVKHRSNLDCRFVEDVTIMDGTVMAPSTPFTKIWRVHNNGAVAWPHGTKLVWIGGEHMMTDVQSFEVELPPHGCLVGMDLNVAIPFIAPQQPGQHVSYWRMSSPSGMKFGQCVWVLIQVQVDPERETRSENLRSLNLNLPPDTADFEDLLDLNVESLEANYQDLHSDMVELLNPVVEGSISKEMSAEGSISKEMSADSKIRSHLPQTLNSVVESMNKKMDASKSKSHSEIPDSLNSVVEGSMSKEMDASNSKLPSHYVELQESVGEGNSSKVMEPNGNSSDSTVWPDDLVSSSKVVMESNGNSSDSTGWPDDLVSSTSDLQVVPTVSPPAEDVQAGQVDDGKTLEQTLLKELDEMGFKEIDLNKKVLRENEYDLERSLDELCCFAEWDPMLEELQSMGFPDTETNRRLLIKNGGSIKRVVMDLIAGERS